MSGARATATFRWRLAIGAVLIAGGYIAWLAIPFVATSNLGSEVKAAVTALLGATPLLTKLVAIGLLGRPTIDYLRRHSFKWFDRDSGPR
jgi:hypothetical protein